MSLLSEIYEYLEYERLIEEGRDPRELLHYKFQGIPSEVIDKVIDIDPTKKKSYSQWLLSKWGDESHTIVDNLENGRIEQLFQHYKEHQDIQIKDCPSVADGLRAFVPEEDSVLTKSTQPTTYIENLEKEVDSELANDFDIVFDEDDWVIAVPNTYEAECKLGENMKWCTANSFGNGYSYYERYLSQGGKFYVNFDMANSESRNGKDYPYTRYQFHFESRQFMDKDDNPVDLYEIGLPEGAIEFYEQEGYDPSEFENEEARLERYYGQRYENQFDLNDNLYLNIEFDDNYNYHEPNDNTSFYVFDDNDERDPISWQEIPNPHSEDVVIVNNENYLILKGKYENKLLVINETNGYREWSAYEIGKYIELPEEIGVFGLDARGCYSVFLTNGSSSYDNLTVKNCENIFVNRDCTNGTKYEEIFVETVGDGGYHSLFAISYDTSGMECIVKRDIPTNGEYFTLTENGLVEGKFRSYRIYDDDEYDEGASDFMSYHLEEELENGDYIISCVFRDQYGVENEYHNILKRGTKEPLLNQWFTKFMFIVGSLYVVAKGGTQVGYFKQENGEQIGEWYNKSLAIDREYQICGGRCRDRIDIISAIDGEVIANFKELLTKYGANGKLIVLDYDGTTKCFDYINKKFCLTELTDFKRFFSYGDENWLTCQIGNSGEKAIFDFDSQKIVVRGLKDIKRVDNWNRDYVTLTKLNGKENVFNLKGGTQVFSSDVDFIYGFNDYVHVILYSLGNKYYAYDYEAKETIFSCAKVGNIEIDDETGFILILNENRNTRLCFRKDGSEYVFNSWETSVGGHRYGRSMTDSNIPQNVVDLYNKVTSQQLSVSEQFRKMVKRINEATRLSRIDFVD